MYTLLYDFIILWSWLLLLWNSRRYLVLRQHIYYNIKKYSNFLPESLLVSVIHFITKETWAKYLVFSYIIHVKKKIWFVYFVPTNFTIVKERKSTFFSSALKSNPLCNCKYANYARVEYKLPIKYLIFCLYSYHIIRSEVSRRHHSQSTGPKPSVDIQRLEPCSITAFNFGITQSTGGVYILNIAGLHEAFDEVLFSSCFETDHVHAHFSAVITAGEPIPSGVSKSCFVTGPRDPIAFSAKCKMTGCKCKRSIENKLVLFQLL